MSADGALGIEVVKLSQKPYQPKPKACTPKGKQLGGGQKAKPSQARLSSLKLARQPPTLEWKIVSSKSLATNSSPPLVMKGLANLNAEMNIMGFTTGGSRTKGPQSACNETSLLEKDHAEAVQPDSSEMRVVSPVEMNREKCSQQYQEPESSNH